MRLLFVGILSSCVFGCGAFVASSTKEEPKKAITGDNANVEMGTTNSTGAVSLAISKITAELQSAMETKISAAIDAALVKFEENHSSSFESGGTGNKNKQNINDPQLVWWGIIANVVMIPLTLLAYTWMHRSKSFLKLKHGKRFKNERLGN